MKQSSTPEGANQLDETLGGDDYSGGMANLLMSQKDEVAKAMPNGMAGALGLTDLGFQDTPAGAPAQTPSAQPQTSGGGMGKLLIPLMILGVLGFLGWKMLGNKVPELNLREVNVPDVNVPDVDLGSATDALGMSADDVTGNLKEVFGGYSGMMEKRLIRRKGAPSQQEVF